MQGLQKLKTWNSRVWEKGFKFQLKLPEKSKNILQTINLRDDVNHIILFPKTNLKREKLIRTVFSEF